MNIKNKSFIPWAFSMPNIILFSLFSFLPILTGFYFSFTEYDGLRDAVFIGWSNYIEIFKDPSFWGVFFRTALFSSCVVPAIYIASIFLALLLAGDVWGKSFFRAIIYWPAMMSFVVIGAMWKWFLGESFGIVNVTLNALEMLPVSILSTPNSAFIAVVLITTWARCGFFMVIFLAGIQSIPKTYYEAAVIDGANKFVCFFYITYPLLRPTSFLVILLSTIEAFKVYPLIINLTSGGPGNTTKFIIQYAYDMAFQSSRVGYANAVSMLLFLVLTLLTILQMYINKNHEGDLS